MRTLTDGLSRLVRQNRLLPQIYFYFGGSRSPSHGQLIEVFLMEYRGKQYLVFEGDEPNSWRWAVTLDDLTTKTGETKSRGEAITQVVLLIDGVLSGSARQVGRSSEA